MKLTQCGTGVTDYFQKISECSMSGYHFEDLRRKMAVRRQPVEEIEPLLVHKLRETKIRLVQMYKDTLTSSAIWPFAGKSICNLLT